MLTSPSWWKGQWSSSWLPSCRQSSGPCSCRQPYFWNKTSEILWPTHQLLSPHFKTKVWSSLTLFVGQSQRCMLSMTNFANHELKFWDLQILFAIPARWLLHGGNSPNPTLFTGRRWGETELSCRATFSTFSPSIAPESGRLSICESDTRFSFGKKWQRGLNHCTSKTCTMVINISCDLRCLCNDDKMIFPIDFKFLKRIFIRSK